MDRVEIVSRKEVFWRWVESGWLDCHALRANPGLYRFAAPPGRSGDRQSDLGLLGLADARLVLLDAELPATRQVELVQVGGNLAVADAPLVLLGELGLLDTSTVVGTPGVLLGDVTQHAVARLHRGLVTTALTAENTALALLAHGDDVRRGLDDGRVRVTEEVVEFLDVADVRQEDGSEANLALVEVVGAALGGDACGGGETCCNCHAGTPSSLKCCNNGTNRIFRDG